MKGVLERLAEDYPALYLDPDLDTQEEYRRVVLKGGEPAKRSLAHYRGSVYDRLETAETPAGQVRVVTLGERRDFELVLRGLMAAKDGPRADIPETKGAALLTVFNWPRIRARLALFPEDERTEEFRRFTSFGENYTDLLAVLSRGPYSGVPAAAMGLTDDEWLVLSDTIRRYHELTHAVCRRMYPDGRDPVRDELVADAVGIYAAFGKFDPDKEELFLGIREGIYCGGRLENYTDRPEELAGGLRSALERMEKTVSGIAGAEPFSLIPALLGQKT